MLLLTLVQGARIRRLIPRCHLCLSHPVTLSPHAAHLGVEDLAHPSNQTAVFPALRDTSPRISRAPVWVKS